MSLVSLIKRLRDIMRNDAGVGGNEQRLTQIVWILFLKIFDYKEQDWELEQDDYKPIIPVGYRWRDWAAPRRDDGELDVKNMITGEKLIDFVNNKLFRVLSGDSIKNDKGEDVFLFTKTDKRSLLVKEMIKESSNFMKNGVLLRQVINLFEEIDFSDMNERHAFNDIYETLLKGLQKDDGEFYTPRAITQFITEKVDPSLKDNIADFACGTGGFLVDAMNHIIGKGQVVTTEDSELLAKSIYGMEKKQLPYMLCTTNLMLNNIGEPRIEHGNSLETNVTSYTKDEDKFEIILMNPPYGGSELEIVQKNFPVDLRDSETADLFVIEILYRLKENGRCGVILPDGFMFGTDNSKTAIKKKLMEECNLHTIIRMPESCFAPYTSITTNFLFFDKTGPTKETWVYRFDLPNGQKFSMKKNPITREKLYPIDIWWNNRVEIKDKSLPTTWKSKKYTINEIIARGYNIDLCGFPVKKKVILSPEETVTNYKEQRAFLDASFEKKLNKILAILKE